MRIIEDTADSPNGNSDIEETGSDLESEENAREDSQREEERDEDEDHDEDKDNDSEEDEEHIVQKTRIPAEKQQKRVKGILIDVSRWFSPMKSSSSTQ